MSHEPATPDSPQLERRFSGRLRLWEIIFLGALAAGLLAAVWSQSRKTYFNNDELLTAVLAANPSFSGMWHAIRAGGELNPPLFFALEWIVAHTAGTGEFTLRAISAVAITLAGWVMFFTVRPLTGPRIAALAVAMFLGLGREVFGFAVFARYYGLLLLLVAVAAFFAMRFPEDRRSRRRDFIFIFLTHCAMAYLHLYGLLYSGVIFAAMLAADWLRRRPRWSAYAAIVAAWIAFGAWIPSLRQQMKSVAGGVYTPPNLLDLGFFLEQLTMGTPLALVLLLAGTLALLALISSRTSPLAEEANACSAPLGWSALVLIALALMSVPIVTWAASHRMYPPPYMLRYVFPIVIGWVFLLALALLALLRLPRPGVALRPFVPPWVLTLAWCGMLALCLGYQPLRAHKFSPRAPAAFVDEDFGHPNLPIVFENSWYYLQRAWYGRGREYVMLIDHDAAEADSGWYTKNMEREFRWFSPHYDRLTILYFNQLPDWPDGFIAVDDDYTKTFEWVFAHHPELKVELLGTRKSDPDIFGEQRFYLVRKPAPPVK